MVRSLRRSDVMSRRDGVVMLCLGHCVVVSLHCVGVVAPWLYFVVKQRSISDINT